MTFNLKAENSSGTQRLIIHPDHPDLDGQVAITLVGSYQGRRIQIDFEAVDPDTLRQNLKMLINQL